MKKIISKFIESKLLVGIFFLLLLFILKFNTLNLPFIGDDMAFLLEGDVVYRNNFIPNKDGYYYTGLGVDSGHPPIIYEIVALNFLLTNNNLQLLHIFSIFLAFLGLFFTYLLGKEMFNKETGFISALILFFSPLYFAQSSAFNLELPLTTFSIMSIYFAYKRNMFAYLITGSLLILLKEPAVFTILAILIYVIIKNRKKNKKFILKELIIYSTPLLILATYTIYHYQHTGSFFIERGITNIKEIPLKLIARSKSIFFDDFKFMLSIPIILSLLSFRSLKNNINKKKILLMFIITTLSALIFILYLKSIINFIYPHIWISKSLGELITKSSQYSIFLFLTFILLFFIIIFRKSFRLNRLKDIRLLPFLIITLLYLFTFSITLYFTPRYLLPIYPIFMIIGGYSIQKLFGGKGLIIMLMIIALFATQYSGLHNDERRLYVLETNMEYLDVIKTHQQMSNYILENYPDAIVLTSWPMNLELRYPYMGYVNTSMKVIDLDNHYPMDNKLNKRFNWLADWYEYKYIRGINVVENDITKYDPLYKEELLEDDFNLFYYSPQSASEPTWPITEYRLRLIKRFESNGKYTELYAK